MKEGSYKDINPLWALTDPLTVQQAAALIANVEPSSVVFLSEGVSHFQDPETGSNDTDGITWVNTSYIALINAISSRKLKARLIHDSRAVDEADSQSVFDIMDSGEYISANFQHVSEDDEDYVDGFFVKKETNWAKTMIDVDNLKSWLSSKNMKTGFFFDNTVVVSGYLDTNHPRYSAKLASAIKVWEAMDDENLLNGKMPKNAMTEWLTSRYKELELVHNEKISKQAIDNVVLVVNWQTGGGAPKTPS
jgi:hypothetical protein